MMLIVAVLLILLGASDSGAQEGSDWTGELTGKVTIPQEQLIHLEIANVVRQSDRHLAVRIVGSAQIPDGARIGIRLLSEEDEIFSTVTQIYGGRIDKSIPLELSDPEVGFVKAEVSLLRSQPLAVRRGIDSITATASGRLHSHDWAYSRVPAITASARPRDARRPRSRCVPLSGGRVTFLLQASKSMNATWMQYIGLDGEIRQGPSFDRLKVRLIKLISQLDPTVEFNVLAFDSQTRSWSDGYQHCEPGPMASAISWVNSLKPSEAEALIDVALVNVLAQSSARTIVLLSDGIQGSGGSPPSRVAPLVREANRSRAVDPEVIHVVSADPHGLSEELLQEIARDSDGMFERN